jgi:lipopolysaccharide/colanic/teichoic acid biosynthesis glycosyltransferase
VDLHRQGRPSVRENHDGACVEELTTRAPRHFALRAAAEPTQTVALESLPLALAPARPSIPRKVFRTRDFRARLLRALSAGARRAFQIGVALPLLIAALPLMIVIAIAIKLESPGPVFFRCERVGRGGKRLRMLKFRKMVDGATGPDLTGSDDERFTRIGRLLANYKLDELPQLLHVIRGDMTLVGPRPETAGFVERFADDYEHILQVRPGIVGLSQLAFARESAILDRHDPIAHYLREILPQKLSMDRYYVENRSLALDLRIVFWTIVAVVVRREVAVHRATGRLALRVR